MPLKPDMKTNPYGVVYEDHLRFLCREKVLRFDPEYGFYIGSELTSVTKCGMDGKAHREDHKCPRSVGDTAVGLCASERNVPLREAVSLMVKGAEPLEKWRQKAAAKYGWVLPSKQLAVAQSVFTR